jgi:type IV secretion system protein VirB8
MNQAWYQRWMKSNPSSPLNLYRDGSSADVQVISVSFFTRASGLSDLAQVRYVKLLQPAGGGAAEPTHYIASIQYAYGKAPSDPKARLENPLGFKVLSFHTEVEVLRESAAAAATAASDSSNTPPQRAP